MLLLSLIVGVVVVLIFYLNYWVEEYAETTLLPPTTSPEVMTYKSISGDDFDYAALINSGGGRPLPPLQPLPPHQAPSSDVPVPPPILPPVHINYDTIQCDTMNRDTMNRENTTPTLQGGTLQGGTLQGGALQGGALQGGALQGGALQGDMPIALNPLPPSNTTTALQFIAVPTSYKQAAAPPTEKKTPTSIIRHRNVAIGARIQSNHVRGYKEWTLIDECLDELQVEYIFSYSSWVFVVEGKYIKRYDLDDFKRYLTGDLDHKCVTIAANLHIQQAVSFAGNLFVRSENCIYVLNLETLMTQHWTWCRRSDQVLDINITYMRDRLWIQYADGTAEIIGTLGAPEQMIYDVDMRRRFCANEVVDFNIRRKEFNYHGRLYQDVWDVGCGTQENIVILDKPGVICSYDATPIICLKI